MTGKSLGGCKEIQTNQKKRFDKFVCGVGLCIICFFTCENVCCFLFELKSSDVAFHGCSVYD